MVFCIIENPFLFPNHNYYHIKFINQLNKKLTLNKMSKLM